MRGSRCARFEVRTVGGREDINNILLLMCYKGGALWNITRQYYTIYTAMEIDYDVIGLGVDVITMFGVLLNITHLFFIQQSTGWAETTGTHMNQCVCA